MSTIPPHRPGNRVVRKRLDAQAVITLASDTRVESAPTATSHAKVFLAAVLVVVSIGTALLMLPWATEEGDSTGVIDALFTAVSAFSVTGLVTLDTQSHWSLFGEFVILILIQLGGFGFMAGTSMILIMLGRGSSLRANMMMQDGSPTMSLREVYTFSRRIVRYMLVAEIVGAVVLSFHFARYEAPGTAIWWGVFHSISAFCNAGFDLQSTSLSMGGHARSPLALTTIALLIQLGSLSFMVVADVWRQRRWRSLQLDTKLVLLVNFVLVVGSALWFLVVEWNSALAPIETGWKPLNAGFQAIAARTAGFSSADWTQAHNATIYLWVVVMMIGGAAGSTAGGVKLATIGIVFMAVISTLKGQPEPQAFGRRIAHQVVYRALALIAIFMTMHFVLSMMLVMSEDILNAERFSFVSLMFEAMSALATVGLSTGVTSALSDGGKLVLVLGMFIGRLGPITLVYALTRRMRAERFRYPEASIRIG